MKISRRDWLRLSSTATLGTLAVVTTGAMGCGEQGALTDCEQVVMSLGTLLVETFYDFVDVVDAAAPGAAARLLQRRP